MDIIEEIQNEVRTKFNKEISEEEIEAIINSQSRATKIAMENGEDVRWIYFGMFKIKLGRKGFLEKSEIVRKNIVKPFEKKSIKVIDFNVKIDREEIIKVE